MKQNGEVNLDELLRPRFVTLEGKRIPIRALDGTGYELMKEMDAAITEEEKAENVFRMYGIAKRCVQSDPEKPDFVDVMGLTPEQVGALVGVAVSTVERVEASAPKRKTARGKRGTPSP